MHMEMLIDGNLIGGPCDQAVPKAVIKSPWDGHVVGTAAEGNAQWLNTAISAAHDAFPAWSQTTSESRADLLRRIAQRIRKDRAELAALLVDEIGKPIALAEGEVDRMAVTFELAAKLAVGFGEEEVDLSDDPRGKDYRCTMTRRPVGVILGIVPYNWPYNLAAHKIAPALATGNTLVIKPSPRALLSTYKLGHILHQEGVPAGVVNVLDAPNAAVQSVCQNPQVAMVSFTGSDAVGWPLKAGLPDTTLCTLELGGDAFAIVEDGADLEWTVSRLCQGAFNYAGQICISLQHALIHTTIYSAARERLIEAVRAFPAGDPSNPSTLCGPMITPEAAAKVEEWIQEAEAAGAKVLVRGKRDGNLLTPTLIENVPPETLLGSKEVFGPVLAIASFMMRKEAIDRVNNSAFGLQAGVFTALDQTGSQDWNRLNVGTVVINDSPVIRFDRYPYGGIKRSGWGHEGVPAAMMEMSRPAVRLSRKLPV